MIVPNSPEHPTVTMTTALKAVSNLIYTLEKQPPRDYVKVLFGLRAMIDSLVIASEISSPGCDLMFYTTALICQALTEDDSD